MEAPDKIYVYIPDDDIVGTASVKKGVPHQFVTEEYTRIDAFIEKARKWFEKRYEWIDIDGTRNYDKSAFEDFKNYIKESKL